MLCCGGVQKDLDLSRRSHKSLVDSIRRNFNPEDKPMKEWLQAQVAKERRLKELEAKAASAAEGQEVRRWGAAAAAAELACLFRAAGYA